MGGIRRPPVRCPRTTETWELSRPRCSQRLVDLRKEVAHVPGVLPEVVTADPRSGADAHSGPRFDGGGSDRDVILEPEDRRRPDCGDRPVCLGPRLPAEPPERPGNRRAHRVDVPWIDPFAARAIAHAG